MKKFKNLLLSTVFGVAALSAGTASAVTINEFEAQSPEVRSAMTSAVLQQLVDATARHSGRDAAMCMINHFTQMNVSLPDGSTTSEGMLAFVARMQLKKGAGKADSAHIEDILEIVYGAILQDECLDPEMTLATGPTAPEPQAN